MNLKIPPPPVFSLNIPPPPVFNLNLPLPVFDIKPFRIFQVNPSQSQKITDDGKTTPSVSFPSQFPKEISKLTSEYINPTGTGEFELLKSIYPNKSVDAKYLEVLSLPQNRGKLYNAVKGGFLNTALDLALNLNFPELDKLFEKYRKKSSTQKFQDYFQEISIHHPDLEQYILDLIEVFRYSVKIEDYSPALKIAEKYPEVLFYNRYCRMVIPSITINDPFLFFSTQLRDNVINNNFKEANKNRRQLQFLINNFIKEKYGFHSTKTEFVEILDEFGNDPKLLMDAIREIQREDPTFYFSRITIDDRLKPLFLEIGKKYVNDINSTPFLSLELKMETIRTPPHVILLHLIFENNYDRKNGDISDRGREMYQKLIDFGVKPAIIDHIITYKQEKINRELGEDIEEDENEPDEGE